MIHRPGLLVLLQRDNADEGIAVLGDMNPLGAYAGQTDAPFSPFLKPRKTAGVALSSSSFRRSGVVGSDQIKLSSGATAAKSSGCRIMRIANFGTYPTSAFIKWVPMDIIPFPDTIFMGKSGYRESLHQIFWRGGKNDLSRSWACWRRLAAIIMAGEWRSVQMAIHIAGMRSGSCKAWR
jgi:hypothetical protein